MHVLFDPVTESIVRQIKSTIWRAKNKEKKIGQIYLRKTETARPHSTLIIWNCLILYSAIKRNYLYCDYILDFKIQQEYLKLTRVFWDTTNSTEKNRGIYTVGWNNHRKRPNTVGKRQTVSIILRPHPKKLR